MVDLLKENWNQFVLVGVSLMTLFGEFVVTPPSAGGSDVWFRYGKFLVALLVGLWLLPIRKWSSRNIAGRWWAVAAVFALISTGAFLKYNDLIEQWTVKYFGDQRVVVGQTLTDDAKAYREKMESRSTRLDSLRLLRSYAGDAAAVWKQDEISFRQRTLALWYLVTLLSLASAVVTVSQAAFCAKTEPRAPEPTVPQEAT